jgi:hypothetical protein
VLLDLLLEKDGLVCQICFIDYYWKLVAGGGGCGVACTTSVKA